MTRPLNVLVACEASGRVRDAFRDLGHNAWSCDLLGPEDIPIEYAHAQRWPAYHWEGDVLDFLDGPPGEDVPWDMMIGFPPCTYLTNAGARWLYGGKGKVRDPERWFGLAYGAAFFNMLWVAKSRGKLIERVSLENPVMHEHARALIVPGPTQTIQPHYFGTREKKATQLYLRGLPPLKRTHTLAPPFAPRVHHCAPGPWRPFLRSLTDPNVATQMAWQWGGAL